jgi:creatinine amidohydrolase
MIVRNWWDLTTADFQNLDVEKTLVYLAIGAVEQHGEHLPLFTDACLAQGLTERLVENLREESVRDNEQMFETETVLLLPFMNVSNSCEHAAFSGTLSLSVECMMNQLMQMGSCIAKTGLRKLLLFNTHGGNPSVLDLIARQLRIQFKMLAVVVNMFALPMPIMPDGSVPFTDAELKYGIHGGELETSMMLALRPDLVKMSKAGEWKPVHQTFVEDGLFQHLALESGPARFGWVAQDLTPGGVCGNAAAADAHRGKLLLEHFSIVLAGIVRDAFRFPLSTFV